MMENKQRAYRSRAQRRKELLKRIVGDDIPSDVDGSYTGMSDDGSEPVQDADDL